MYRLSILALCSSIALSSPLSAGIVIADFNDLTPSPLGDSSPGNGQEGGFGWLQNDSWANTNTITVVANDLTAPASTGYGVSQSENPQSIQGSNIGGSQCTRALDTPLQGTIWFSFLLNQPTDASRGGITFNQNSLAPANPRIVATGSEVRLALATLQGAGQGADRLTAGETALILGRLTIDDTGLEDSLEVWINPDLSGGETSLPTPDTTIMEELPTLDGGITRIGVQSYSADSQGGILDSLRLSDRASAFSDVTRDVELILDDPNLTLNQANPFADLSLTSADAPVIVDLTLNNTGTTQDLIIADTTAISGPDTASYTLLTALPITIAPGASANLRIQLDPAGSPRATSALLAIVSNDSGGGTPTVALDTTIASADGNLLLNGDFEADQAVALNWTTGSVSITEGIAPGSNFSASLDFLAFLNQDVAGEADWTLECFFQAPDTPERAFNVLVDAPSGNINIRFQGTANGAAQTWNAFDNNLVGDNWGEGLGLPAVQPGAVYRLVITGTDWGLDTATYDLGLSAPNSSAITNTLPGLVRFQNSIPTAPPIRVRFSSEFGNGPGFVVDDVRFFNGEAPPSGPPVISNFSFHPETGAVSFDYSAQIGTNYSIESSPDLVDWTEISQATATATTETFTESGVAANVRFYRVTIPE